MSEREQEPKTEPEPSIIQPDATRSTGKAQPLGDGVERDQLHPPHVPGSAGSHARETPHQKSPRQELRHALDGLEEILGVDLVARLLSRSRHRLSPRSPNEGKDQLAHVADQQPDPGTGVF